MIPKQSIWWKLDRFPPVLVRLLAKNQDGTAATDHQLAEYQGLDLADVRWLSLLTSWDEVPVGKLRAFVTACGVDFANREQMRNANRYLNSSPKFTHLCRDKNFPAFKEMLKAYYDSQT